MFNRIAGCRSVCGAASGRAGRRRLLPGALLVLSGALLAGPAAGHHSAAVFDSSKEIVLKGTVRAMEWTNPHVWIRLDVSDDGGNTVEWGIEASNPLDLGRKGWTKTTFEPGDEVSITVHPAKNDKPYGSFVHATLPDGSVLGEGSITGDSDTSDPPDRDEN